MKKIEKALSNIVLLNEESNRIIKEYSVDKFKIAFGNQEANILSKLNYPIRNIESNGIEIDYIEHEPFDDKNISLTEYISLVNAIKEIHSCDTKGLNVAGFRNAYYDVLIKEEIFEDKFIDQYELGISEKALTLLIEGKQVLLHNDLVEGNILKVGEKIKLIDFEYSGVGNYLFDLASFCTEREMTESEIKSFLNLYDNNINMEDFITISIFLQIFWARWAMFKFKITNKEIYKVIFDWKIEQYKKLIDKFVK